jgi:hypothetical protein
MDKQRGGSFTVSGWLALALLAAGAASAATNLYLARHRTIEVSFPSEPTEVHPPKDDLYEMHAFPDGQEVCDSFDTICWIKI